MTPTRHITRLILLQVAFLLLGVCHDVGCVAHAGQYRHFRKTVLKPIRVQGRANAGYPFLQSVKHTAATLDHVSAPLGWLSPGGIIRGLFVR